MGGCIDECEEEYVLIQKTLQEHPRLTVIHPRLLQEFAQNLNTCVKTFNTTLFFHATF